MREGLESAEKTLTNATTALEVELGRPALRDLAKARAQESQAEIEAAKNALPQLREDYEATKAFDDSMKEPDFGPGIEVGRDGPER